MGSIQSVEGQHAAPTSQNVLLLHQPKQKYSLTADYAVPQLRKGHGEVLIKVRAIGLNPIDWKSPDFNFGLPELPYVSGREFAGEVVRATNGSKQWKAGQKVIAISTDYRDIRKGAYQEFAVGLDYNLVALPPNLTYEQGSAVGVAFVAAVLALGVSLGLDFSTIAGGPDLFRLVRSIDSQKIPEDVRRETLNGIEESERLKPGDWLAVWGGSATSANMTIQLAKIAGLKVAVVVDHAKHGAWLSAHKNIRPDLLVDSHDPQRAVDIIRRATRGKVRAGLDTRGRETATHLLRSLLTEEEAELHLDSKTENPPTPPGTPGKSTSRAHLVGMTGLPKCPSSPSYAFHAVPIKLFHEVPEIGAPIASWLGRILEKGILSPPDILGVEQGLKSVNAALDRMRNGEISGGKLVVKV